MEFAVRPPVWGKLAYYGLQIGVLAFMIYYYRTAVKSSAGPQTQSALLVATVISALLLGLGTWCMSSVFT